jgi:hypothetical protein
MKTLKNINIEHRYNVKYEIFTYTRLSTLKI